ncbi:MAG: hypothetical protein IJY02_02135, partial [Oscillospiraceae bacterium]|nr:hypothetical protein [Oscillospiraceae bacterium]
HLVHLFAHGVQIYVRNPHFLQHFLKRLDVQFFGSFETECPVALALTVFVAITEINNRHAFFAAGAHHVHIHKKHTSFLGPKSPQGCRDFS